MYKLRIVSIFLCFAFSSSKGQTASIEDITEKVRQTHISQPLNLCRLCRINSDNESFGRYTEKLSYSKKFMLNLSAPYFQEKTAETGELAQNDGWKNHLTATTIKISGDDPKISKKSLKSSDFKKIFSTNDDNKTNLVIDWASAESKNEAPKLYKRKSTVGNRHSEPQMIADFDALWTQDSTKLIKKFVPQGENLSLFGLSLHSSFDACDTCLNNLVTFRKEHRKGQQSLTGALKDKLKDRYKVEKENTFVLLYHSQYPYKEATYHAEDEKRYYPLDYSYSYKTGVRTDSFLRKEDFTSNHVLSPHCDSTPLKRTPIYMYNHSLSGKKASYTEKDGNLGFHLK